MQQDQTMTTAAMERAQRLTQLPLVDMSPQPGFASGIVTSVRDIWERRHLLNLLTRREIKAKYKDSVLGLLWSLIRPLIQLMIYYLVMGKFLGASKGIDGFAIYVFTGLSLWGLFSEIVSSGTGSVLANSGIVKKIKLPREVFPLASLGSALFNFAIQCVVLIVGVLLTGGFPISGWNGVGYLFAAIGIMVIWGLTFSLILSAANVYLRDIQYLVEVVLMVGFWATPVVYKLANVTGWIVGHGLFGVIFEKIYVANPITMAVFSMQRVAWRYSYEVDYPGHFAARLIISLVVGAVALILAEGAFNRMQRNFAQEL
jgi:ABC-2 type transport system permease protein